MKALVIGGTGLVGSSVVEALVQRGADVRVFARKKSAVAAADKHAVEVAEGDLLDPATVEKSLDGVDKLYLLNAVVPDELTQGLRGDKKDVVIRGNRGHMGNPGAEPILYQWIDDTLAGKP